MGNKHPKDDSQIIEELKVLSGQLRNSVQTLLVQLDERNKEIEQLKATVKQLEDEKTKGTEWQYQNRLKQLIQINTFLLCFLYITSNISYFICFYSLIQILM